MSITTKVLSIKKTPLYYEEDAITIGLVLDNTITLHFFSYTSTYNNGDLFFIPSKTLYYMEGEGIIELVKIPNSLFIYNHYEYMRNITLIKELEENYLEKDIYLVYRDLIFIKDILDAHTITRSDDQNANQILEEKLLNALVNEYSTLANQNLSEDSIKRYYRTINYIHDHYQNKLSLAEIANNEGVRKTSFAQSLKQISGLTFLEMASEIRLKRAQYLLATTDMNINEISKQVGFSDFKYFYRDFQKIFKMTPTNYRNLIKDYSQNFAVKELDFHNALTYIQIHNNELSYIKLDTRLYQQYLLLKQLEFNKVNLNNYEVTLDLYNEMNYLIYNQTRYLTWYGLTLILNLVSKYGIKLNFQIAIKEIRSEREQDELIHLLTQTINRLTKRQQKQISVTLALHNEQDYKKANALAISIYQHCNVQASTVIL